MSIENLKTTTITHTHTRTDRQTDRERKISLSQFSQISKLNQLFSRKKKIANKINYPFLTQINQIIKTK